MSNYLHPYMNSIFSNSDSQFPLNEKENSLNFLSSLEVEKNDQNHYYDLHNPHEGIFFTNIDQSDTIFDEIKPMQKRKKINLNIETTNNFKINKKIKKIKPNSNCRENLKIIKDKETENSNSFINVFLKSPTIQNSLNIYNELENYNSLTSQYLTNFPSNEINSDEEIFSDTEEDIEFNEKECIEILSKFAYRENEEILFNFNSNNNSQINNIFFDLTKFDKKKQLKLQKQIIDKVCKKIFDLSRSDSPNIYVCHFCDRKFENYFTLGGHASRCSRKNNKKTE